MNYQKVLISVPTRDRVGIFPTIVVLVVAALIFWLSFQSFFFDLSYAVTLNIYFDPQVLDTMILLTFPSALLYCFVFSQVRMRLCLKRCNFFSVFHTIAAALTVITSILYVLARPEQSFASIKSILSTTLSVDSFLTQIKNFTPPAIMQLFNLNDSNSNIVIYNIAMLVTSYSFVLQFCVILVFTSFACSMYGQQEAIVLVRESKAGRYQVMVDENTKKSRKAVAK